MNVVDRYTTVLNLYEEGKSYEEIGKIVGLSRSRIGQLVREGVSLKTIRCFPQLDFNVKSPYVVRNGRKEVMFDELEEGQARSIINSIQNILGGQYVVST